MFRSGLNMIIASQQGYMNIIMAPFISLPLVWQPYSGIRKTDNLTSFKIFIIK